MFNWFNRIIIYLKESQVKLMYVWSPDDSKEYSYFLNEEIEKWLKENNIQYKFKSNRSFRYPFGYGQSNGGSYPATPFSVFAPKITLYNKSDALLFKLTWW